MSASGSLSATGSSSPLAVAAACAGVGRATGAPGAAGAAAGAVMTGRVAGAGAGASALMGGGGPGGPPLFFSAFDFRPGADFAAEAGSGHARY